MYLRKLTLNNVRAFREAQFEFGGEAGVHIIVGINGVGKSTVLDTLRLMLSQVFSTIAKPYIEQEDFLLTDIHNGFDALSAELSFDVGGINFTLERLKPLVKYVLDPDPQAAENNYFIATNDKTELKPYFGNIQSAFNPLSLPLAIYFSPRRSLLEVEDPRKRNLDARANRANRARQNSAYNQALVSRSLRLNDFHDWMRGMSMLVREGATKYASQLDILNQSVKTFLEDCSNLRPSDSTPTLLLDKNGVTLDVRQLSDGERSVLALVLEISLRLAQANPEFSNPTQEAEAIILIDELDLHLHPGWQREIVKRLEVTFPKCQFIVSTHSAQIIGEVQPSRVTLLTLNNQTQEISQAYGLDANYVLEYIMGVPSRSVESQELIDVIDVALGKGHLRKASALLRQLKTLLHGLDNEGVRLEASLNSYRALIEHEKNNKK